MEIEPTTCRVHNLILVPLRHDWPYKIVVIWKTFCNITDLFTLGLHLLIDNDTKSQSQAVSNQM